MEIFSIAHFEYGVWILAVSNQWRNFCEKIKTQNVTSSPSSTWYLTYVAEKHYCVEFLLPKLDLESFKPDVEKIAQYFQVRFMCVWIPRPILYFIREIMLVGRVPKYVCDDVILYLLLGTISYKSMWKISGGMKHRSEIRDLCFMKLPYFKIYHIFGHAKTI